MKDHGVAAISLWVELTDRRSARGKRNLPEQFETDKIRFEDCFGAPSLRHFTVLITGWVVTVGTRTISQVISTLEAHESEHFASTYRFLSKARREPDKVAAVVLPLMVETLFPGVGGLILRSLASSFRHVGPISWKLLM